MIATLSHFAYYIIATAFVVFTIIVIMMFYHSCITYHTGIPFSGPRRPDLPIDLKVAVIGTETAIIEWTVPTIAFTPESYVVYCGTSIESLLFKSDPVESGNNFSIIDFKFSTQLSFLSSNTQYYYCVIATNTEGSTASAKKEFQTKHGTFVLVCDVTNYNLKLYCISQMLYSRLAILLQLWEEQWLESLLLQYL